jgi:hypothetical protein
MFCKIITDSSFYPSYPTASCTSMRKDRSLQKGHARKGFFTLQTIQVFFFRLQNTTKASIQHITKTDTIILWCLCNSVKHWYQRINYNIQNNIFGIKTTTFTSIDTLTFIQRDKGCHWRHLGSWETDSYTL